MDNVKKLLENRQFEAAEAILREFTDKNPYDGQALYYMAYCLFSQDKFDESARYFIMLGDLVPDEPEVHFMTGRCFFNRNNYREAIKYFRKAIDKGLSGNNLLKSGHLLALAYCGSKRFNSAEKIVRRTISKSPDYYPCHDLLGRILISRMDYKRAREIYNKILALKSAPEEDALFHIAFTYIIENKIHVAINKLEEILSKWKDHLKTHYTLAALYFHSENMEKAAKHWRKCVELDPDNLGRKAIVNIMLLEP